MDDARFDRWTKALASGVSRRGILSGLAALPAGLVGVSAIAAACPPGQVSRRRTCLCKQTGRAPVNGTCPCPKGQSDTGDGLGCLACRADKECPTEDACTTYACVNGASTKTTRDCDDGNACTSDTCDPATGCIHTPIVCPDNGDLCTEPVCDPITGCGFAPIDTTDPCTTEAGEAGACADGVCVRTPVCTGITPGTAECATDTDCAIDHACINGGCFTTCAGELDPCSAGDACTTCACYYRSLGTEFGTYCMDFAFSVGICTQDSDCPAGSLCSLLRDVSRNRLCARPCPTLL